MCDDCISDLQLSQSIRFYILTPNICYFIKDIVDSVEREAELKGGLSSRNVMKTKQIRMYNGCCVPCTYIQCTQLDRYYFWIFSFLSLKASNSKYLLFY